MTYDVSSGTLNLTHSVTHSCRRQCKICEWLLNVQFITLRGSEWQHRGIFGSVHVTCVRAITKTADQEIMFLPLSICLFVL